ncbi:MAG: copper homeostasis membrane protein CopD [Stellaceae bacterium]
MDNLLIAARALHFAAAVSLCGIFAFRCLVAAPAYRQSGIDLIDLTDLAGRRELDRLARWSLVLALISGAVWLLLQSSMMSGQPLGETLAQGVVGVVLTRTRFGEVWIVRAVFAAALALCLIAARRRRIAGAADWAALISSTLLLGALAWVGHSGATPGAAGRAHLAADILHLLAAGAWLGMLVPLALLLADARRHRDPDRARLAWLATARFSMIATAAVAVLFAAGLVNTWFLAGNIPALIGTAYGRLVLLKVAIFAVMLAIAAVNRLRLSPRLEGCDAGARSALGQLRRNALIEAGCGIAVLAIVGALGMLPPGLHTEPVWPLPFRIEWMAMGWPADAVLAALALLACLCAVAIVGAAAAGHYRYAIAPLAALPLSLFAGWMVLKPAVAPAFPTSFFASPEAYAAPSVARGMTIYAASCAICHGASGRGDGPAAAGLPIRPADLTAPHLFAHSPGDLFWWVSHGAGHDVMPGFAGAISTRHRWDVINFILARAAGVLSRGLGPEIRRQAGFPVPDFAFEQSGRQNGRQQTLAELLKDGTVLLVLFAPPAPTARLAQLAAAAPQLAAAKLDVLAVDTGPVAAPVPDTVSVSGEVRSVLALFAPQQGVTELMLDRSGTARARWTSSGGSGLANAATLAADARRVARFAAAMPSHAGHAH